MAGDFFSEFLVDEWSALDRELGEENFLARKQEVDQQRMQQEESKSRVDGDDENRITEDDLRRPFDRKRAKESKKERLERVKQEYSTPFISIGSDLEKRRKNRKSQLKNLVENPDFVEDGTMANSPNFTQLHEQNEPTIMPLANVKGFVKSAAKDYLPENELPHILKLLEEEVAEIHNPETRSGFMLELSRLRSNVQPVTRGRVKWLWDMIKRDKAQETKRRHANFVRQAKEDIQMEDESDVNLAIILEPPEIHKGKKYVLPDLPYEYDALEPHIDAQTMELHHGKHHQSYVDGLNKALKELIEAKKNTECTRAILDKIAFNGSGHVLHSIFWTILSSEGSSKPNKKSEIASAIDEQFGNFANFKAQFIEAASSVQGSGWAILTVEPLSGRLFIQQAEKHQNCSIWGAAPILPLDVWEHAYYLTYQNDRSSYIKAVVENLINWEAVNARYMWATNLVGEE